MNIEGLYLLTILLFCIITNSLHPPSNYLWIGFFLSCSEKVLQLLVLCMVCECLTSHPNFFVFQIVCFYLYWLLLPVWGVCLLIFSTFLSRGAGAPVETSKWAVLQRKRFLLLFLCSHFCCPGALCFQFYLVWKSNNPGLRTACGFLTAATTKVFASCSRWCRWRGLSSAFNFVLTALRLRGSVLEAQHTCSRESRFVSMRGLCSNNWYYPCAIIEN